jgi:hypothetical protein
LQILLKVFRIRRRDDMEEQRRIMCEVIHATELISLWMIGPW